MRVRGALVVRTQIDCVSTSRVVNECALAEEDDEHLAAGGLAVVMEQVAHELLDGAVGELAAHDYVALAELRVVAALQLPRAEQH